MAEKNKLENFVSSANKQDENDEPSLLDVVGLLRALQQMERNVSVSLMYSGLRIPQFRLLDGLDVLGQATVTEISKYLHITRATASVMVNELIKAGIVATIENPSDRRSFHIRLTELGHGKLRVARRDLQVFQAKITQRHSSECVARVNAFAERELAGLEK